MVTDPIKFVYLVGDGVTTDFSYAYNGTVGFDADVADDVKAAILNPDGTRDINPNFAVMQDTYGNFIGKIRFAVAPVANAIIYIYRATPQTQETEYKTSSGFDAKNVENDFDKLTKLVQETSSHARNKTVQLDMFQENVLKFILASEANQNQMLFFDFNTLTFRFTSFTKGQAVISSASASDDKTDIMLTHLTDEGTGLPYLAFSLDQGVTWKPMNFAEISAIVNSANAKAQEALDNSETAVSTSNDAKAIAQNAATDAENAVQTATNATDIANAANATAESAKTTATNANTKADVAVSTANSALQKANTAMVQSSDALADAAVSLENSEQAVATANAAKNTADGIDGKATSALTNSEQAVATANAAKNTADGIDAKAQEALDNSETAVSTANDAKAVADGIGVKINDVQGDVDTLNAKVPSNASASNKMATAAEISNLQTQITSNDTDIANLQSTKADKATTLAGYGITDAYTKTEVDAKVSSVYRFRGSVATYSDLPTTGQVVGDVWNVEDTGANYAWSGTEWDKLSETVDLTPYLTKAEASSTYATQSALAEVSTAAETAQSTADKADGAAEVAQQTANVAGTTAAQALSGLAGKVNIAQGTTNAGKFLSVGDDGNITLVDGASGASGAGRNIGDIFWTTRTDSALNGAVEANGAQYNFADLNGGDNNVQALLESGALPSVSIADYESAISSKGWCDKIGYDSGSTSFRVPKLTSYIIQKENIPVIGNGMTVGVVGATGNGAGFYSRSGNYTIEVRHAAYGSQVGESFSNELKDGNGTYGLSTDPTKSGMITDLSNDSFNGRVMIQLFNSATDEAVATCTEVLSDVADLKQTTDGMIDYVVESQEPTEANGYTWYRLYKSGWCEQGGKTSNFTNTSSATNQNKEITLPIEMYNIEYNMSATRGIDLTLGNNSSRGYANREISVEATSTTIITIFQYTVSTSNGTSVYAEWQVSGMSAQGA